MGWLLRSTTQRVRVSGFPFHRSRAAHAALHDAANSLGVMWFSELCGCPVLNLTRHGSSTTRALDAPELVHVQAFVAHAAVERLGEAVLSRLARLDVVRRRALRLEHSVGSKAMDSGPLSERIVAGRPRAANSLASTPVRADTIIDLAGTIASASRVNSSITVSTFIRRLPAVASNMKS